MQFYRGDTRRMEKKMEATKLLFRGLYRLDRDNGKENGSYDLAFHKGYIGSMAQENGAELFRVQEPDPGPSLLPYTWTPIGANKTLQWPWWALLCT